MVGNGGPEKHCLDFTLSYLCRLLWCKEQGWERWGSTGFGRLWHFSPFFCFSHFSITGHLLYIPSFSILLYFNFSLLLWFLGFTRNHTYYICEYLRDGCALGLGVCAHIYMFVGLCWASWQSIPEFAWDFLWNIFTLYIYIPFFDHLKLSWNAQSLPQRASKASYSEPALNTWILECGAEAKTGKVGPLSRAKGGFRCALMEVATWEAAGRSV